MAEMKSMATSSITLIGDLVGSRSVEDREAVHHRLVAALAAVNSAFDLAVPLRITVGDEYQGIFSTLGGALQASLRLRLALLPVVDVRQGIGCGSVSVLGQEPRVEDGPGWWAARAAMEVVEAAEGRATIREQRTAFVVEATDGPDPVAVNAALMLRDQAVGGLSPRSLSVLDAVMAGRAQQDIAAELGISASAVSQRVRADGLGIIVASDEMLGRL